MQRVSKCHGGILIARLSPCRALCVGSLAWMIAEFAPILKEEEANKVHDGRPIVVVVDKI